MMKRYTLIIFSCLLFCGIMDAQEPSFTLEPLHVSTTIEAVPGETQDFELHNQFVNTSDETKTFVWERMEDVLPKNWNSAVCDKNLCYLPQVSSQTFTIEPRDTFDMIIHAYNEGNTCTDSVMISLNVYEEDQPNLSRTATYTFYCSPTATDDIAGEAETLRLYPNPTDHAFQLTSTEDISEIIVYNIVGKQIKQFDARRGSLYDVGDLQKGMYFVRLLSEDGTVEKTLRLNKE